jgi:hypothetical protein
VQPVATYFAAAYDGSQAFLWVYSQDQDWDFVKYELNPVAYAPSSVTDLFIGITPQQSAIVNPPGPNHFLYPFEGRIAEIAIYNKSLTPGGDSSKIMAHAGAAFHRA